MRVHFIAIGGAAMHNLAIALKLKGYHISGSDDIINNPSFSRLKKHNLLPENQGWFKEKISKTLSLFSLLKKGKNNANKMKGMSRVSLFKYVFKGIFERYKIYITITT